MKILPHLVTGVLLLGVASLALPASAQQPPPPRWIPFTDSIGQVLRLTPEQMGRATQMNLRFQKEYDAMGNTPWNDPRYPALQDRRNMEARGILDQDQYKQWLEMDRPVTTDERAMPPLPPPAHPE